MPKDKKKTLLERVASAVNLEGTADEDVVVAAVEEAVAQTDPNAPPQDQGAGGPDQAVMDLMNELRSQLMQMGVVGADVTLADALQAAIDYLGQTDTSGGSSQATGSIAEALSLAKTATAKDIIAAINAQRTTTVPSAELKDAKDRIAKLEDERDTKRAQELVASVIEAGKINPNSEKSLDWARKFAKRDPDEFVAHFADAPVLYSSEQQTPTEANVNKRDSAIVAAIREYGEQMVTCSVKSYVNAALDSDGLEHLTDDEAKKHNI